MADHANLHCSFCGKSALQVKKLIAGSEIYICNECVDVCHGILNDTAQSNNAVSTTPKPKINAIKALPSPREIKEFLDRYVIGQDNAKETLSVAVYNHYKRLDNPIIDDVEIDKANILVHGKTGSGKTYLAQTIARILNVPFVIADATNLTQAGYVGEDVETIVGRLLQASDNDPKKCERGIIFIDEIDKKAAKQSNGTSPDVGGEGVQQALLKLLEGSEIMVTANGSKKNTNAEMVKINTKNILFIVGGAFIGLDKIVEKSANKDGSSLGINRKSITKSKTISNENLKKVEPEHLISYGLIPELVGRLPIITYLDELSEEQLARILIEPKNAIIKQYTAMFKLDGVELIFLPETLLAIAKLAKLRKTGARALRSVIEGKLLKIQFDLPDMKKNGATKIVIHPEVIDGDDAPEIIFEKELGTADGI